MLLTIGALAIGGCGEADGGADAPRSRATPAPQAAAESRGRPLPKVPGPLKPGVYTTSIKPRLRLKLGRGWRLLNPDTILFGEDPAKGPILSVIEPARLVDPRRRFLGEKVPTDALIPVPRDLAGWFARHPRMNSRPPERAMLGGRRVQRVDLRVDRGYPFKNCPGPCVLLFAFGPGQFGFVPEKTAVRIYVIDGPTGPIPLGMLASSVDRLEIAERVLSNASFTG